MDVLGELGSAQVHCNHMERVAAAEGMEIVGNVSFEVCSQSR